ncbi:MAG TPA: hypothetical protein ENH82_18180 [bacterium]|nr:hypothetical protein [bacterium]
MLRFKTFLNIYIRSFFTQGSFSHRYRQNLGFAFCMEPVGKELWENTEEYNRFIARHSEYYNGNPFMSTLVLGAVANMEEKLRHRDGVTENDIRRFKKAVGPATGSVGDRLFWSNLRPFGLLSGLLFAFFFGIWGVLIFLAVFNIPMFLLKLHWLRAGYRLGPKVVIEIKNYKLMFAERIMEIAGSALVTFISVVYFVTDYCNSNWGYLGGIGLFIFSVYMLKRNLPLHIVFPLAMMAAILVSISIKLTIP